MSPIRLQSLSVPDALALLPILRDAEEGDDRIRAAISDLAHTSYAALVDGVTVGAAVVAWEVEASEILLLAVAPERRRQGIGARILAALADEGRRCGTHALLVGTATASLANLAFYQRCGFRIDHIRPDYFAYIQPPISENDIPLRDMLVLRHVLTDNV
jgi:ribosomal protein S18 acetylase RimI-like enzyme